MRLYKFGKVVLPEAAADQGMPINARSSLIELENGSIDQDGDRLVLGPARLTLKALLVEGTELTTDSPLFNLRRELGKGRNILYAKLRDGTTQLVTYAKLTSIVTQSEVEAYSAEQPVTITWEQDYPFWMHANDGWFLDQGYLLDTGMVLDGNYITRVMTVSPMNFGIDNPGTARIGAGTITIKPRAASSLANLVVTNFTNNLAFMYNGTIAANTTFVIDFKTKSVTVDGVSVYDDFSLAGERQVEWMALELGSNSIRVSGTIAGTVDFYWQYKRHYL